MSRRQRWLLGALLALAPPAAAAQVPTDSALAAALRLVTEGRGDSARALVRARLRDLPATDSLYPQTVFVAGVVAESFDSAMFHFRRVALDYSASPWADDALLRVAQLAFAAGDLETAQRSVRRILDDYPLSDVRAGAAYWAGRVLLEQDRPAEACLHLRQAETLARDAQDVELANRAAFYLQRCGAVATDTAARDTTGGGPVYAVQVAAVRSAAAADEVMRSLRAAGFDSRVVRDADGLLKVRVGRFRTRAEAARLQTELRRRIGGRPFVVEEP